ncbi:MAG: DUF29 family protein [Dolichospermum sp.]
MLHFQYLAKSPSLKNYLPEIFDEIWQDVLKEIREDYPQYDFPDLWLKAAS